MRTPGASIRGAEHSRAAPYLVRITAGATSVEWALVDNGHSLTL